MRHAAVLLLLALLAACKPSVPSGYIQPARLERLLYDWHVAAALAEAEGKDAKTQMAYQQAVLKKYDVSEAEFDSTMRYYSRHADQLNRIYEHLSDRLGRESEAYSAGGSNGVGAVFATADTADVWNGPKQFVLTDRQPLNRQSFSMKADTAFHAGDSFLLEFNATVLRRDGSAQGRVLLCLQFQNDSVAWQNSYVSSTSHYTLRMQDYGHLGLKAVRGYFIQNGEAEADTKSVRLIIFSAVRLIRMHEQKQPAAPATDNPAAPVSPATAPKEEPLVMPANAPAMPPVKADTLPHPKRMMMKKR